VKKTDPLGCQQWWPLGVFVVGGIMKVKELIKELSELDGDLDVVIHTDCDINGAEVREYTTYEGSYEKGYKPEQHKRVRLDASCWCGAD
jgi:hypothetical protein